MIDGMTYFVLDTYSKNQAEIEAKKNIDENTARKIVFPDGKSETLHDNTDIKAIISIRNRIFEYIDSYDLEKLRKIEVYYVSWYLDNKTKRFIDIKTINKSVEYLIKIVKDELKENRDNNKSIIANEYTCFFLTLGIKIFNILNNTPPGTEQKPLLDKPEAIGNQGMKSLDAKPEIQGVQPDSLKTKKPSIPLFGKCIYQGKNNILYADSKAGKTYFSIEIAKNDNIKKPLYILLEDYSGDQAERHNLNLANRDYKLLDLRDFKEEYNHELEDRKGQANIEIFKHILSNTYHRITNIGRQIYIDAGLIKKGTDKLDRIAVIERIMKAAIENGIDFICIDSLKALMKGNRIDRDGIDRMLELVSGKGITFLLIHHPTKNDKDVMADTDELRMAFDNIYKLEKLSKSKLKLIEEDARGHVPHTIYMTRTFYNEDGSECSADDVSDEAKIVKHDIERIVANDDDLPDDKKKNVESAMIKVVKDHPIGSVIPYEDFKHETEEKYGSELADIRGGLKKLKDAGYIKDTPSYKKDGIIILKHDGEAKSTDSPQVNQAPPEDSPQEQAEHEQTGELSRAEDSDNKNED